MKKEWRPALQSHPKMREGDAPFEWVWFAVATLAILGSGGLGSHVPSLAAETPSVESVSTEFGDLGARSNVPIGLIEVTGVTSLDSQEIQVGLELLVGETFDRGKAIRSMDRIKEKYREQGFVDTEVTAKVEWLREKGPEDGSVRGVKVVFEVKEGRAVRFAGVDFELVSERSDKLSSKQRTAWVTALGIDEGERLTQVKVDQIRMSLQDYLAARDYLGARVEVVNAAKVDKGEASSSETDWVRLKVRVHLTDRVVIRFRGNRLLSHLDLKSLVDEQRQLGLGGDYSSLIRQRIEDAYRKAGYFWVNVKPYFFQAAPNKIRELLFVIEEGEEAVLQSLSFDGNSVFSVAELRELFRKSASPLVAKGIYVEQDVESALSGLIESLKSRGYLSARLVNINRQQSVGKDGKRSLHLTAYLFEGDQTRVDQVSLEGLAAFTREEVLKTLRLSEGDAFDLSGFTQGLEALKRKYEAAGYLDFKILNEETSEAVRYGAENRAVRIRLELSENARARVSQIDIEGLDPREHYYVAREIALLPGDFITEEKIQETQARIQGLGVFPSVTIRTLPELDESVVAQVGGETAGLRRVKVILQSGTPGILAGGVGYRNDLGLRAFGQIGYTNLWRENHTLALNGNINKRLNPSFCSTQSTVSSSSASEDDPCFLEYQVQLGYVWPWFLWGPTQLRPRLTAEKTQYLNFDAETVGFASTLERRLMTRYNVVAAMTYSLENTRQFNALAEEDNQSLRIGALIPSLRMDFRDSSLAPSRGLFLSSSFEWASTWLGAQQEPFPVGYTRFLGRADYYVPIGAGATWFMSFRTGFERNLEPPPAESPDDKRYAIPLIKQFALGGAGSLRGFNEQELNLQEFAIAGTASYVNYRTQVDLPFSGAIRFGPFVDAANLLVDRFSLSEDLRVGAGLGFRYQSPVGPVNLDWGFKVNARAGEDPFRFYFSIGVI